MPAADGPAPRSARVGERVEAVKATEEIGRCQALEPCLARETRTTRHEAWRGVAPCEPSLAMHCIAQVRRPERVSAEAEGGRAEPSVSNPRAPAWRVRRRRACRGQAGARGFVYPKSAKRTRTRGANGGVSCSLARGAVWKALGAHTPFTQVSRTAHGTSLVAALPCAADRGYGSPLPGSAPLWAPFDVPVWPES